MKLAFPRFDTARVLVVGDLMLDRYWYGSTSRVSPEAPVPVVVGEAQLGLKPRKIARSEVHR